MKATRSQVERAIDQGGGAVRLFLLYGPDEAGSRELAARLGKALSEDAERIDLTGAMLRADPARLADEAAAIPLFGGRRHIRVEPAGDEILAAVEALLEAAAAGNPVAAVAGSLRRDSKLLKRAIADPAALALASYAPEGADAGRLAVAIGREIGLAMRPDIGRRIAAGVAGDRALIARECEKFALYLDAAPDRPRELEHETIDALGADVGDDDLGGLVDAVLGGRGEAAAAELASLGAQDGDAVRIVRTLLRRFYQLAELRAEVADGNAVEAVIASAGKSLFWKEKAAVSQQLARWRPDALGIAIERLVAAERGVKRSGGIGIVAVAEELMAITRAASRMR